MYFRIYIYIYIYIHINHSRGIFTPQFLSELPKVETNIFHFSCAINACDREANWPMALEILGSMGRHKARIQCGMYKFLSTQFFSEILEFSHSCWRSSVRHENMYSCMG